MLEGSARYQKTEEKEEKKRKREEEKVRPYYAQSSFEITRDDFISSTI